MHHRDLRAGKADPRVLGRDSRVVPLRHLAQEDVREQRAGEAEGGTVEGAQELASDATGLLSETTNELGQTVQRTIDESGNILQTTLDENGEVVDEDLLGNLDELLVEEEYIDEQGRVVSRVRDESGNVLEQVLDDEGNVVDVRAV